MSSMVNQEVACYRANPRHGLLLTSRPASRVATEHADGDLLSDVCCVILRLPRTRSSQARAEPSICEVPDERHRLSGFAGLLAKASQGDSQINEAQQRLKAAQTELRTAEAFAKSKEDAWSTLSSIIHETRDLGKAWSKIGVEGRKVLLDYWVYDALIAVEPVPGMRRANHKAALITLRSAPNTPLAIDLRGERGPG